jgi:hypothetical protein
MTRHQPATPSPLPESPLSSLDDVLTGLEAIRAHGNRDEELRIDAGGFFEEAFMMDRTVSPEDSARFIKKVEALVRSSTEYKAYIGHLRIDLGLNRCSFMPNVDVSTGEVSLEMHHAPLTLYAITDLILSHRLAQGHPVTSLTIADEVIQAHFAGMVGLVPMVESVHKLVHAGTLVVSPHMVHGDWVALLRAYPLGVTEDLLIQLSSFVLVTEEQVVTTAQTKLDGGSPRLREGVQIPTMAELQLLMLAPAR